MTIQLQFSDSNAANKAQHFLMSQIGVVAANVWEAKGAILARVTIQADSNINGADLQFACQNALGQNYAPRMIMIDRIEQPYEEKIA